MKISGTTFFTGPWLGALTLVVAAGTAMAHESYSAGEPGDPKQPSREIGIVMDEMDYTPVSIEVKRGEQIRFVIRNGGKEWHEFMLASTADNLKHAVMMKTHPDMQHHDPNGVTLEPGQSAELLWRFSRAGTFEYSCLISNHRELGMTGTVTVTPGDGTKQRAGMPLTREHHDHAGH
jgi:uncharacterized cupredoxin-like copper-binding protein